MNCKDCQNCFSEYLDHTLDSHAISQVAGHLSLCPECTNEWQEFKKAINFIQNIPMEAVPAGFLTGIHEKLEAKSPLSRMLDWFSTTPVRLAASTGFAVLFVGVVTAVVVQNIPFENSVRTENRVALSDQKEETRATEPVIQLAENKPSSALQSSTDFYPGVPLLSEYEDTGGITFSPYTLAAKPQRKTISPEISFVSTGSGHLNSSIQEMSPFSYTEKVPLPTPDAYLTLHPGSQAELSEFMHQIIHSSSWQIAAYNDSSLTLAIPVDNLAQLNQLCAQHKVSVTPPYVLGNAPGTPQKRILVAVQWH
ncbi:MAG: zf-HC2 domain-containing protein [Desulfobulbaceae bacterium]|uniref:Zf-HC2 domain-containing protein n=1 Tax=Candidatus Desulfobia pelagia TaxID=2841692 RepID=A0A8J6TD86_9BACT|nr:zf-HC2 domain-containing protein [Candidatus Desulfobia pelagia]